MPFLEMKLQLSAVVILERPFTARRHGKTLYFRAVVCL